ncbi:hypothetical protein HK104_001297 [Borealophlyctis nickersoniae]|nr:hypothetical protein HK104_001297 [Borealophlyctis nickersoniae]
MEVLQELMKILSQPTPSSDDLLPAFRQWKKKKVQIRFIDDYSEEEEDSPWNMHSETSDESIAIIRLLTHLEIHQREKLEQRDELEQLEPHGEKAAHDSASNNLIASVADVSYRCIMGGDERKMNSRIKDIMSKCFDVEDLKIGPHNDELSFSDPLWVTNEIVRAWIEGSSAPDEDDGGGDDAGNDDDDAGAGPSLEAGSHVTAGKIVHLCAPRHGSGGTMPTRLGDPGIDLAAVAACFGGDGVVELHMRRVQGVQGHFTLCSYKTADGQRRGICMYDVQDRGIPEGTVEAAKLGLNAAGKPTGKKRKQNRDPTWTMGGKRFRHDGEKSTDVMEIDDENVVKSTSKENGRHDAEEGEEAVDGEEDEEEEVEEGESPGKGSNSARQEEQSTETDIEREGRKADEEAIDGEEDEEDEEEDNIAGKNNRDEGGDETESMDVEGVDAKDKSGDSNDEDSNDDNNNNNNNNMRQDEDKSPRQSDTKSKAKKPLDIDEIIQALKHFDPVEVQRRAQSVGYAHGAFLPTASSRILLKHTKYSAKTLDISELNALDRTVMEQPRVFLKSALDRMSSWEKNRHVVSFQIFIWSVAVVNALDACLQLGVKEGKIRYEAGPEYKRVDMKNRAFITAAKKWLMEEEIIQTDKVFTYHLKIGRRLKELVKCFSEAILLLNYEDDGLQFLSKTGIYKISSEDWGKLTTRLSQLKYSSPWIDCRLPPDARTIIGSEDGSPPRTPRPPHQPAQLPSPAPTPKKKKTAPILKTTLEIFRCNTARYNDRCFEILLKHAIHNSNVRFLTQLVLPTKKNDGTLERFAYLSPRLAVNESHRIFLAPVNRNADHWVAYAGRRDSDGTWSWHFADSMHGSPEKYEIEAIQQLMGLPAPHVDSIVENVSIPRQKDSYSCGPFALEWLLKFMEDDIAASEECGSDPIQLRKKHLQKAREAFNSGIVSLLEEDGGTPGEEWGSDPTQIEKNHLQTARGGLKSGIVPSFEEDGGTPGDVEITSVRPNAPSPARQLFQGDGGRTGSESGEVDTRAKMLLESKEVVLKPGKDDGERSDGNERIEKISRLSERHHHPDPNEAMDGSSMQVQGVNKRRFEEEEEEGRRGREDVNANSEIKGKRRRTDGISPSSPPHPTATSPTAASSTSSSSSTSNAAAATASRNPVNFTTSATTLPILTTFAPVEPSGTSEESPTSASSASSAAREISIPRTSPAVSTATASTTQTSETVRSPQTENPSRSDDGAAPIDEASIDGQMSPNPGVGNISNNNARNRRASEESEGSATNDVAGEKRVSNDGNGEDEEHEQDGSNVDEDTNDEDEIAGEEEEEGEKGQETDTDDGKINDDDEEDSDGDSGSSGDDDDDDGRNTGRQGAPSTSGNSVSGATTQSEIEQPNPYRCPKLLRGYPILSVVCSLKLMLTSTIFTKLGQE